MGVRELKNGLSRALRQVQEGETVEVTDHGRPIARIIKACAQFHVSHGVAVQI